jgi:hypothetical protein
LTEKEYNKQLWIYAILVTVACVASGITGLAWGYEMNSVLRIIIAIAGFCIFLFATVKFGIALRLKPAQFMIAFGLILFFYVASVIYITTRKPPPPAAG